MKSPLWATLAFFTFTSTAFADFNNQLSPRYRFQKTQNTNSSISDRVPDTHVVFPNDQDALDWAEKVKARLQVALGGSDMTILPLTDVRYEQVREPLAELWRAYSELYPEQTRGLGLPKIIMLESNVADAFVPRYILDDTKIAHTVAVTTELLNKASTSKNPHLISGILGHELAHSVFRHGLDAYQPLYDRFYKATDFEFGYQSPKNNELDAKMQEWIDAASLAGDFSNVEMLDLPTQGLGRPLFFMVLNQIATDYFQTTPKCLTAKDDYLSWASQQAFSSFAGSFSVAGISSEDLRARSEVFIESASACLEGKSIDFLEQLSKVTGVPARQLGQDPDAATFVTAYNAEANAIRGLQAIVRPLREKMREVETAQNFADLGYFTFEENADDTSLIIHRYLGWEATGLNNFFELLMTPEEQAQCQTFVDLTELSPTGSFSDFHRATCFRITHNNKMLTLLDKVNIVDFAKEYAEKSKAIAR